MSDRLEAKGMSRIMGKMNTELDLPDWVRHTDHLVSVFDVIQFVYGFEDSANARTYWRRLLLEDTEKEIGTWCTFSRFNGKGKKTPVVDGVGLNHLLMLLKGKRAAEFRKGAADILSRYFAGDQTMHDDIDAIHASDNPMRIFYENGREVQERSMVRQKAVDAYKLNMDAVQKRFPNAKTDLMSRTVCHSINCGVTGCSNTNELKISRGWDKITPMTGRDFMTPMELAQSAVAHLFQVKELEKEGTTSALVLTDLCEQTRKRARQTALTWE